MMFLFFRLVIAEAKIKKSPAYLAGDNVMLFA